MEKWRAFIPDQNDLQCIICKVHIDKSGGFQFQTNFHLQRIKSRSIIFNYFPEVIAAPVDKDLIAIITTEKFFQSTKFQLMLKEMNLTSYRDEKESISFYFGKCFYYTIEYKMAPNWIRIGDYLVNDMHFTSMKNFDAIKLDMNAGTFKDSLQAVKLQLSSFNFNDFNEHHRKFQVQIFPRLTPATVLSVSKQIPLNSSFKNYEDLRNHWRDMYGYELPPTEKDIFYFETKFEGYPTVYLYPNICATLTARPEKNTNSESVVMKFLDDLNEKMPTMFGKQLKFIEKDSQPALNETS